MFNLYHPQGTFLKKYFELKHLIMTEGVASEHVCACVCVHVCVCMCVCACVCVGVCVWECGVHIGNSILYTETPVLALVFTFQMVLKLNFLQQLVTMTILVKSDTQ